MKKISRRDFLKSTALALGAGAVLHGSEAKAAELDEPAPDRMGVLVDTTACVGCRGCERACSQAHDLPAGSRESYDDKSVFAAMRRPNDRQLTVVNRYDNPKNPEAPYTVKVQCMHCDHPACASACIVGALRKKESGAVVWDGKKCIGCRYCMIACPFQVPAFEYATAFQPRVMKCDFCVERTAAGKLPACVESCPVEALTYGRRDDLVRVARDRVRKNPSRYVDHVYGELEVGGTSWLYLAGRDFADLQFPKLGHKPAPGVSESIQHGVFAYFMPPVALYSLLGLVMALSKGKDDDGTHE